MYESMNGTGVFEGNADPNLRVLAGLYYNPNQVVVSAESGIETLNDLKGKRFAPGSPGGTSEVETNYHLTALGMNYPDDIDAQYVGFTEASDLLRNKQLDGAWIMAGVPTAAVTEITATAGGKLVPMDEALIEKLQETYPWYAKIYHSGRHLQRSGPRCADISNQNYTVHLRRRTGRCYL